MERIKNFRKRNRISQVALAEYLEVTQGFISQMENGTSAIPEAIISRLLANPYDWDASMLEAQSRDSKPELVAEHKPRLSDVEILLREMLAEERARVDALQERINELIEENARLKTLIESERKGGVA